MTTAIWTVILVLFLSALVPFLYVMIREPRSLKSGFFFLYLLLMTGLDLILILMVYSEWVAAHRVVFTLIMLLAAIVLFLMLFFPVMAALVYFVEGIKLIRREGFSLTNTLSIVFSLLILLFIFVWPLVLGLNMPPWAGTLVVMVDLVLIYFIAIFIVFCFSAMLNLIHPRKVKDLDQIVVLGSGILGKKVTPLLAGRIDKGIELLSYNPHAVLILSGGQGPGEDIPEATAMAEYALEKGVDPARLRLERASRNTEENLMFSSELFPVPGGKTAIISTGYHVFRALLLARKHSIPCIGYGSRTKLYFSLNALLREYAGYLSLTWKNHLRLLLLLLSPFLIVLLFSIFFH